jgi:hypothetical protein
MRQIYPASLKDRFLPESIPGHFLYCAPLGLGLAIALPLPANR